MIESHAYLWTDGSTILYVGAEPGRYQFRVFLGEMGSPLREIEAGKAQRRRDGGTTLIPTAEGKLHAPKPPDFARMGKTERFPVRPCTFTWLDGRAPLELPRVDPDQYEIAIDETAGTVVVVEKRTGANADSAIGSQA